MFTEFVIYEQWRERAIRRLKFAIVVSVVIVSILVFALAFSLKMAQGPADDFMFDDPIRPGMTVYDLPADAYRASDGAVLHFTKVEPIGGVQFLSSSVEMFGDTIKSVSYEAKVDASQAEYVEGYLMHKYGAKSYIENRNDGVSVFLEWRIGKFSIWYYYDVSKGVCTIYNRTTD
jgi:hypothetical protein